MARPLKKILLSEEQIQYLASIGCTDTEVAHLAGLKDPGNVRKRFDKIMRKGRDEGKTRLRKLQWQRAQKGSDTMLIWLGKQILGQTDTQGLNLSGRVETGSQVIVIGGKEITF